MINKTGFLKTVVGAENYEPFMVGDKQAGDEYIHVIEGSLLVTTDTETYDLEVGDIVLFKKGIKSVWTIKSSFKKFFVIDNC